MARSRPSKVSDLSMVKPRSLSNLLLYAPRVPLEVRGPGQVFEDLSAQFETPRTAISDEP
jgi:hypothetical protein